VKPLRGRLTIRNRQFERSVAVQRSQAGKRRFLNAGAARISARRKGIRHVAFASVCSTTTSGKLQPTWVAWSPWPEANHQIRRNSTHQFGGSTFVTTGAAVAAADCGEPLLWRCREKKSATKRGSAKKVRTSSGNKNNEKRRGMDSYSHDF